MNYLDAHNHLHDERLDSAREEVIAECARIGLTRCVVNGTSPRDWGRVKVLASRYPFVIPAYGVHPWFVDKLPARWLDDLNSLLDDERCVVGEIGIDHWKEGIDREVQEEVFRKQLELARRNDLPVTIHGLKAWDRLLQILRIDGAPRAGFLLHSYSGPVNLIEPFLELGAYFSCAPAFFEPSREKTLAVFREVPLDRLLAETDCPDQAPPQGVAQYHFSGESMRGLNHPAHIRLVYRGLAALRGISEESLGRALQENFRRLFEYGLRPLC